MRTEWSRPALRPSSQHVAGGRIELGETPDAASPDTQIWVFHGPRALETPQSAPAANDAAAAAMALAQPSTRDIPATHTRLYSLAVVAGGRRIGTVIAGVSLAPYDLTRHTAYSYWSRSPWPAGG
jgi:hypothetical protein